MSCTFYRLYILQQTSHALTRNRAGGEGLALATMDIFAGCGGLSEGLHQAGAAVSKWAIEYEAPAAEAFKLNNPEATVWAANCNVILAAAMAKACLSAHCVASPEVRCSDKAQSAGEHRPVKHAAASSSIQCIVGCASSALPCSNLSVQFELLTAC